MVDKLVVAILARGNHEPLRVTAGGGLGSAEIQPCRVVSIKLAPGRARDTEDHAETRGTVEKAVKDVMDDQPSP